MLNNPSHMIQDSQFPSMPYIVACKVTGTSPALYTVNVENVNTGEQFTGARILNHVGSTQDEGFVALPQIDDIVLVCFVNNSKFNPVVIGKVFAGRGFPEFIEGEHIYKHSSGTTIKIAADGIVTINSKKVVLHGDTTVGHTHTYTWTDSPGSGSTGSSTDSIVGSGE